MTAWVGLFEIGKIKTNDVVIVSAAAGAVGELAVQLAKNYGCKVIGIAGGKDKWSLKRLKWNDGNKVYYVNTFDADNAESNEGLNREILMLLSIKACLYS